MSYDYGDMMLNFELRSFATDFLMPHAADRAEVRGAADFATAYTGRMPRAGAQRPVGGPLERRQGGADEGGRRIARGNFLEGGEEPEERPNADVEIGRLSTMLCHLGNVSYKLGRDVRFDPKTRSSATRKPTSCCARSIAGYDAFPKRVSRDCGGGRGAGRGARRQSGTSARVCVLRCPAHRRTAQGAIRLGPRALSLAR